MQLILYKDDHFRLIKACCDVQCWRREEEEAGGDRSDTLMPSKHNITCDISKQQLCFKPAVFCFCFFVFFILCFPSFFPADTKE